MFRSETIITLDFINKKTGFFTRSVFFYFSFKYLFMKKNIVILTGFLLLFSIITNARNVRFGNYIRSIPTAIPMNGPKPAVRALALAVWNVNSR